MGVMRIGPKRPSVIELRAKEHYVDEVYEDTTEDSVPMLQKPIIIEVPKEIYIEVPVEKIVEVIVYKPVETIIEKEVIRYVDKEVVKYVDKIVEVPVYVKEQVEVPIYVPQPVEVIRERVLKEIITIKKIPLKAWIMLAAQSAAILYLIIK